VEMRDFKELNQQIN